VHLRHREEGRPPRVARFEVVDTLLADTVVVDDDVRQPTARCSLTRRRVLFGDTAELADRAVNPVEVTVENRRDGAAVRGVAALVGTGFEFGVLLLFGLNLVFDLRELFLRRTFLPSQVVDDLLDVRAVGLGLPQFVVQIGDLGF